MSSELVSWLALLLTCAGGVYLWFRDNSGDTAKQESRMTVVENTQKQHEKRLGNLEQESFDVRSALQDSRVEQAKMGEALKRIDANVSTMAIALNDKLDKVAESLAHTQGEMKNRRDNG